MSDTMDGESRRPLLDDFQNAQAVYILRAPNGGEVCGSVTGPRNEQCAKQIHEGEKTRGAEVEMPTIEEEIQTQVLIALPMIVMNLLQFSILIVSVMFVGHLGSLELASASLATSVTNVLGLYILMGMAGSLETLCGQAYGAKQYHMLEIYVQRAVFVLCCTCVPLTILFLKIETILLLAGQTPEISSKAAEYVFWLLPALYASAFLQPLIKFLQTQSIVRPMAYCAAAALAIHVLLCWFFVFKLGLGYRGVAMATSISYWANVVLLATFVKVSNCCDRTWYWAFEIMVLAAGWLANPQLEVSALAIGLNTSGLSYTIPTGLSAAASTRVSNELGAGRPLAVRRAIKVVLTTSFGVAIIVSSSLFLSRDSWGFIFSKDLEVVSKVSTIVPFLCCVILFDGFQGVLAGIFKGAGWQDSGAMINFTCFYVFGIPTGMILSFYFGWDCKGLWTGMITGLGIQVIGLSYICSRTNWDEQTEIAYTRQRKARSSTDDVHAAESIYL
ncbi:MATE family, multidrug and toxin extrusion protein [Marchantia polymorpha subsp. ruderalis]